MPLPVTSRHWESISMDIVGCFPMTHRGHDYFLVVVDHIQKMCVLILQRNYFSTMFGYILDFQPPSYLIGIEGPYEYFEELFGK
jgi:hypothetical protein